MVRYFNSLTERFPQRSGTAAVFLLAVAILGIGADLASTLAQDAHR